MHVFHGTVFFFLQAEMEIRVSREYCTARHGDDMIFLLVCSDYILLLRDVEEFLQKLEAIFNTY